MVIAGTPGLHERKVNLMKTVIRAAALFGATLALSTAGALLTVETASAASQPTMRPSVAQAAADPGRSGGVPVHVPVNVCGNTVDGQSGLNPAFGNQCVTD